MGILDRLKKPATLAVAAGLAAMISLPVQAQTIKAVDGSFKTYKEPWKPKGQTIVRYKVLNMGGRLAVCGVYALDRPHPNVRTVHSQYMRALSIQAGNKMVMKNLKFFQKVDADIIGQSNPATCKITRSAWKSSYSGVNFKVVPTRLNFD